MSHQMQQAKPSPALSVSKGLKEKVNILLVDDTPQNLTVLEAILKHPEYNLVMVTSGKDALMQIMKMDFALILTDVMMPVMDGLEFASLVKGRESSRHIPILFLTAMASDMGYVFQGYSVGAVDYLHKPLEPEIVRAKVAVFVELYRVKQKIKRQEERMQLILANAYNGFIAMDSDGVVTDWNIQAERILGFSRDEAIGKHVTSFLIPLRYMHQYEVVMEKFLRTGSSPLFNRFLEIQALHKMGHEVPIEFSISSLKEGDHYFFATFFKDITQEKHLDKIKNAQLAITCILSNATCRYDSGPLLIAPLSQMLGAKKGHIWEIDPDRTQVSLMAEYPIQHTNREESLLYPLHEVPDSLKEAINCAQDPSTQQHCFIETSGHVYTHLTYPITQGGVVVGVLEFLKDPEDTTYSSVEVDEQTMKLVEDICLRLGLFILRSRAEEELKNLADRLRASNLELESFASVASHDLQEPLRKIQAFGDQLNTLYALSLGEQGKDFLNRMQNAASRMRQLIDDLLAFSRITSKARPFAPVDLDEVMREVLGDLEIRIQQKSAIVNVDELPIIQADRSQMRQLFQNLVGNALKFHGPNNTPVIHVRSQKINDSVNACEQNLQIEIQDNGIGLDEKYLDRIFNVFERLHSRSQYEGTGIGLAICRKIVERHGGKITAQSKPSAGATFIVSLPIQ